MKKILSMTRVAAIAFSFVISTGLAAAAPLPDSNNKYVIPVELKFIGNLRNLPLFQLNFANSNPQDEITIDILDDYGNSLYREITKGNLYSKKFLFDMEGIGDAILRFEICSKKSKRTIVYEINRTTKYVEETRIQELK